MAQLLEQLFKSKPKVKLLKFFLRNPEGLFQVSEIARRIKEKPLVVRREIEGLREIRFLSSKLEKKAEKENLKETKKAKGKGKGKTKKSKKKQQNSTRGRKRYFYLNPNFPFYSELKNLVLGVLPVSGDKILKKVKNLGKIKLVVISGLLINKENTRADILIVGDDISKKSLNAFLKNLEAEVGKELSYAVMNTEEFEYRYEMFDKFIRDILDGPHEKIVSKLKLE